MAACQANSYKNQKRNERKSLNRQTLFITEYVQHKYPDIYREAALLYNEINIRHPQKPDLRKSTEFRRWKNRIAVSKGQPTTSIPREKEYIYNRMEYNDIVLNPTTESSSESPAPPQENQRLNGPLIPMTMCLNIPLMPAPRDNTSYETTIEEGDQITDPSTPQQISPATQEAEQCMDPSTPQQISPTIQEAEQCMDPSTPQQISPTIQEAEQCMDPSTPQQISPTIQEAEQYMDPSIMDQISPQIIEKIIRELQLDPNLKDLMDDVQREIEEELIGLEVDIPELDDPLEEELMCW